MTTPVVREQVNAPECPSCGHPMRRESNGVRTPPMPAVFWFCTDKNCGAGMRNRIYSGG